MHKKNAYGFKHSYWRESLFIIDSLLLGIILCQMHKMVYFGVFQMNLGSVKMLYFGVFQMRTFENDSFCYVILKCMHLKCMFGWSIYILNGLIAFIMDFWFICVFFVVFFKIKSLKYYL